MVDFTKRPDPEEEPRPDSSAQGPQNPYQPTPPPYPPYGAPAPGYGYGHSPAAPWGVDPLSGLPYSDKQKVVAGVLQILLPFGIGRFYTGHTGLAVAQLLVCLLTCGIGGLWSMIDGIILLVGNPRDVGGRPLR
ncbi:putative membrane protein [Nocardioides sp. J9]|uniref:TM2 domain-containing protein n=1 Tax=Nocardioides sp. J9 TaxID=935844 RepID=UPI0011A61E2E|nr:TM2 domain-containing protein [Nocardioides sp. J9]TWG99619.1 putative membrane protein [Nocardioides sp. J9]